jgi:hypothetical protein
MPLALDGEGRVRARRQSSEYVLEDRVFMNQLDQNFIRTLRAKPAGWKPVPEQLGRLIKLYNRMQEPDRRDIF